MVQSDKSKGLTILGATGSIGCSTLDVVERHPSRFHIVALTAHSSVDKMLFQCKRYRPEYAVMSHEASAEKLDTALKAEGLEVTVLSGEIGLITVCQLAGVDMVMAAIVGSAGLRPSLAAAAAGKRVLLANKEALVISGALFMDEVQRGGAELLPIDSEHNAIFQCLPANAGGGLGASGITRILLTGSGGPFLESTLDSLPHKSPNEACKHPNWSMGRKISVDSATMMNKGLEVIEASWLFNAPVDKIEVVIHPQSVVHSMVEYVDGSVLAQLGQPDMRTAIAYGMAWPDRIDSGVKCADLFEQLRLDFGKPDFDRFPCLRLAFEAGRRGDSAPAVLNGANEEAVAAFLDGRITYTDIAVIVGCALERATISPVVSLESVLQADRESRVMACEQIKAFKRGAA